MLNLRKGQMAGGIWHRAVQGAMLDQSGEQLAKVLGKGEK